MPGTGTGAGASFEVRWGTEATSKRMRSPPSSAMIQVNTANDATRVVTELAPPAGTGEPGHMLHIHAVYSRCLDWAKHSRERKATEMRAASVEGAIETTAGASAAAKDAGVHLRALEERLLASKSIYWGFYRESGREH